MGIDFWIVLQWWGTLFLVGAIAFPLTKKLFPSWYDQGYFFAKATGMAVVTYLVYFASIAHIIPFTQMSVFGALVIMFVIGIVLSVRNTARDTSGVSLTRWKRSFFLIVLEELFFFLALLFWSWVKGHEPSVHGLEKFMDYGFMKSIFNSPWFPAPDMWYAGYPINYYYFGHTVVAVLTKLSGIDLSYTFNLMLSTIFALTLTMSFSIGFQLIRIGHIGRISRIGQIFGGVLTALLVTLAGNMQTIYAFTKGYTGEDVKPFWTLLWPVAELWQRLPEGLERYWYANATRFIPFTIHEFPSYSFVVSDIHGHVLSLPFVLLAIGLLIMIFGSTKHEVRISKQIQNSKFKYLNIISDFGFRISDFLPYAFYGLLVAILLTTNALDGPIYLGLFLVLFIITNWSNLSHWTHWVSVGMVTGVAGLASVPFLLHFKSFVSGLAINCPPAFLAGRKIGIFLFEEVTKCQHSPLWMMWILWGFFIFSGGWFLMATFKKHRDKQSNIKITQLDLLLVVFFLFSIVLIIFPEFFYFKDIYPAHFRSNTMFKLGYQAFILFSIVSGYMIIQVIAGAKGGGRARFFSKRTLFIALVLPQLILVLMYPVFSVRSYFDSLRTYKGLDGLAWLREQYPDDYAGIVWLNAHALKDMNQGSAAAVDASMASNPEQGSPTSRMLRGTTMTGLPVIVEADGDSYTDHARFSAFTGLPTIIGWPVHEWLWRGTYDVVAPRREEVRVVYESDDMEETRAVLQKYAARYIVVGQLERKKFTSMNTEKFAALGTLVFRQGETAIYLIDNTQKK